MDSPQSVVSPLKNSSLFPEPEKQSSNLFAEKLNLQGNHNLEDPVGAVEVYIHQARDIHNICIYQKQDVYAKLCLTSDPEKSVSTKIINGGGRNPVFNENLRLSVRKADSSLKCEIWMLSRVRNYLEDQLLGFALVPVSEILLHNGKLEKEFSLSSTDLFHSPAGFVHLSVSYIGAPPEVIPIPAPTTKCVEKEESVESPASDLDKIEFPDPKVVNENHKMVEEYLCSNVDSQSSVSSDTENQVVGPTVEIDSPPSSVSTNGVSFHSSETPKESKSTKEVQISPPDDDSKEKISGNNGLDAESNASGGVSGDTRIKPVVTVNIEPESKVVQQDIVDMYMKSMQQFTESLAKMKLPMDFENGPTSSENSSSDQKTPGSKNSGSSRVFYGSRAFF